MNRSVKSLLSVSVLAPVAALALAAAPADAAPGPSTTLLYESYAAAAPVAQTLPEPVTQAAGQTAEMTTLTVDGALEAASAGPGARAARCTLNPGKAANSNAGTSLPDTPLASLDQPPLSVLPKGGCLAPAARAEGRSAANALPVPSSGAGEALGGIGDVPSTASGSLGGLKAGLNNTKLGRLPGTSVLPGGRRTGAPLSMPLADVPGTLSEAEPAGLPVGTVLFPPAGRSAQPGPADDVLGQANGAVNHVGTALDETENGLGQTVQVLKARDRVGGVADGPVSLLTSSGLTGSALTSTGTERPAGPALG